MSAAWIGSITSVIALLGGLYVYFKHERRLNAQDAALKDLQIEKSLREREEDLSADLKVELVREPGNNHIVVTNISKVDALNVQLKLEPDICNMPRQFPFPQSLSAGQSVNVSVCLSMGGPNKVVAILWWEDPNHIGVNPSKVVLLPTFS